MMLQARFKSEFNVPELMDVIQEDGNDPKIIPVNINLIKTFGI